MRARTWVKQSVPCLLLPSDLDAQFGTPYPRSAGFDTDIGAFIESSSMSSPLGPMAPLIINNDEVRGETFLPGQIFVFGGFALPLLGKGLLMELTLMAHQTCGAPLLYTNGAPCVGTPLVSKY